jgi:hexosaminidase
MQAFNMKLTALFLLCLFCLAACQPAAVFPPTRSVLPAPSMTPTPDATRTSSTSPTPAHPTATPQATPSFGLDQVIPRPVSVTPSDGMFYLTPDMQIELDPAATPETKAIAQYLADHLNPATGYAITLRTGSTRQSPGNIRLSITSKDDSLGAEGYTLSVRPDGVQITANHPAGLFYAVQTLRQLLPASIEANRLQAGPWVLAAGTLTDYPRFAWRGVMLDVARHFFSVQDVKRYIDEISLYKINTLHLHLADDQGWRIEIRSWPDLTTIGAATQVGGGPGGFYTQADYAGIVAYAQSRYVTIVPEIDMPGHVTAALASYPELNCSGIAPAIYTTAGVDYSSLCLEKDLTYQFVDDVIGELAALTPGPFIHVGGDEAGSISDLAYITFIQREQVIVQAHGKQMLGWEEIAKAQLSPTTRVQHWYNSDFAWQALRQDSKLVMSPVMLAYLNLKYTPATRLGVDIAGYLDVEKAYDWDPATVAGIMEDKNILGVEAPLWTETLASLSDLEYMTFPRLPGYAEIGWSPQAARNWEDYRLRLAGQGPRLTALGINFYKSLEIDWPG